MDASPPPIRIAAQLAAGRRTSLYGHMAEGPPEAGVHGGPDTIV
jgi:hypothetical protein